MTENKLSAINEAEGGKTNCSDENEGEDRRDIGEKEEKIVEII